MSKAVGIDLGTTNSVIAHIVGKNTPKVLDNQESKQWTPSVVFADENGDYLVGEMAKASGIKSPENMIFSIKRFMGRDYDDEVIRGQIESGRFPYVIERDARGEVMVKLRNKNFSPPEVSAIILEALKQDAEVSLGEEVSHAAITVPAYFGTRQKEVTRLAGRLAGLNVLRVLPEPTAAALAFGVDTDMDDPRTVLVYDLGGGTFDVTVMFIGGGTFMDQGKSGDVYLGGDDFDNRIVDRLIKVVQDQYRLDVRTLPNRHTILLEMKKKAEEAKIRLSRANRAPIIIPGLVRSGGRIIDIEYELERGEFNSLVRDLVERSINIVYEGIKKANTTIEDIDTILLVGGSTRVPLVEEEMRRVFGDKVARKEINPMLCVAQGAAIQTLMVAPDEFESKPDPNIMQCESCGVLNLKGRTECRACGKKFSGKGESFVPKAAETPTMECPACGTRNPLNSSACKNCGETFGKLEGGGLMDKLSKPIGIELEGGGFEIILNDSMFLPTEPITSSLHTMKADQRRVVMPIYEGEDPEAKKNQYLGMVEGELPAGLPEKTDVHVTLQADIDGTLKVTADVPSRPDVQIHAVLNWKGSPVSARPGPGDGEYQSSDWGSQDDMGSREIPSGWQNEAMMVRFMAAAVREEGRNIMPPNEYNIINQLGDQLEIALQNDDEQKGRRIMATLQPQIENLIFVNIGFAKLFKQDPELPRKIGMQKAEQLAKALNRLEQYRQSGQVEEYMRVYRTEFEALFAEILESITSTGSGGFSDLLGKRSGTWRTS